MIHTAAMLYFQLGITPEMMERLATRHRWVWIKKGQEVLGNRINLAGPADFSSVSTVAAELKAINPRVRVGIYAGGIAAPDSHHPSFDWLDDADLLHASPTQPLSMYPVQSPAEPGSRRVKVINYARKATRDKLIAHWRAFLADHNLDGVIFDTWDPEYMAAWMALPPASPNANGGFGLTSGGVEGAFHTQAWWQSSLGTFTPQLRWALAQDGREVWVNGLLDYPYDAQNQNHQWIGKGFNAVSALATGALSEYGHTAHRSAADLRRNLEISSLVSDRSRGQFWLFQPHSFTYSDPGYPWADDLDMRRFYLTVYLLLQNPPYTLFGYHGGVNYQGYTPTPPHEPYLFDGGEDWDRDFGVPAGGVEWAIGGIAYREYGRGVAAVNATDANGYLPLPVGTYRIWNPTTGGLVEITASSPGMNLPAKTGLYLWRVPA